MGTGRSACGQALVPETRELSPAWWDRLPGLLNSLCAGLGLGPPAPAVSSPTWEGVWEIRTEWPEVWGFQFLRTLWRSHCPERFVFQGGGKISGAGRVGLPRSSTVKGILTKLLRAPSAWLPAISPSRWVLPDRRPGRAALPSADAGGKRLLRAAPSGSACERAGSRRPTGSLLPWAA